MGIRNRQDPGLRAPRLPGDPQTKQPGGYGPSAKDRTRALEAFGYLAWLSEQARDELFRSQVTLLIRAIGAPPPERTG